MWIYIILIVIVLIIIYTLTLYNSLIIKHLFNPYGSSIIFPGAKVNACAPLSSVWAKCTAKRSSKREETT